MMDDEPRREQVDDDEARLEKLADENEAVERARERTAREQQEGDDA